MLAYRALAAGAPIDDLILWAVPGRGRAWLHEQRAYARMVASRRPEDHRPEADPEGEQEYIGFLLGAETERAIEDLRLNQLEVGDLEDRRVLLFGRDGLAPDKRLREHLEQGGAAVSVEDTDDYSTLMLHPQEARAPEATIARTIAWLSEAGAPRPAGDGRSGGATALERSSIVLPWNGQAIRETPLSFEGPRGEIFGVLSESAELEPAPVCAVWLSGGALRHTGPNRAWVEAARRWAARGVRTVRVDLPSIGDSEGAGGIASQSRPVRAAPHAGDAGRSSSGCPSADWRAGSCSAASAPAPTGRFTARWPTNVSPACCCSTSTRSPGARRSSPSVETGSSMSALRGYGWRRLANRDLNVGHMRLVASSLRPGRLRAGAGHPVERAQSRDIELALDRLRDQGTQRCCCSPGARRCTISFAASASLTTRDAGRT